MNFYWINLIVDKIGNDVSEKLKSSKDCKTFQQKSFESFSKKLTSKQKLISINFYLTKFLFMSDINTKINV